MSIDSQIYYRKTFLASDYWKTVRTSCLAKADACCFFCRVRNLSNDVHHIVYPKNLYHTPLNSLVVLCRSCHDFVHQKLGDMPHPKTKSDSWKLFYALRKLRRQELGIRDEPIKKKDLIGLLSTGPRTVNQLRQLSKLPKEKFATQLLDLLEAQSIWVTSAGLVFRQEQNTIDKFSE